MKNSSSLYTFAGLGAFLMIGGAYLLLSQKPTVGQEPGGKMGGPGGKKGVPGSKPSGKPSTIKAMPGAKDPFASPSAGLTPVAHPRLARIRQDPFLVDWKLPTPPPYVFDEIQPIRLASDYVETPPVKPYEVRETPVFRVSGIMNGDGVYAILETPTGAVIVKPGSEVKTSISDADGGTRTYRVMSINSTTVKLRAVVGNIIYVQDVPLTDVGIGGASGGSGPVSSPGGGFPGGGGSGSTGGGGRRGGFPGAGGGGKRGGTPAGGSGSE